MGRLLDSHRAAALPGEASFWLETRQQWVVTPESPDGFRGESGGFEAVRVGVLEVGVVRGQRSDDRGPWAARFSFDADGVSNVAEARDAVRAQLVRAAEIEAAWELRDQPGGFEAAKVEAARLWAEELAQIERDQAARRAAVEEIERLSVVWRQIESRMWRADCPRESADDPMPWGIMSDPVNGAPAFRAWLEREEARLERFLAAKGVAAQESLLREKALNEAREEAMNAPGEPVPWLVRGNADLSWLGRKQDEGFGLQVEGSAKFLPGGRQLVAIEIPKTSSRGSCSIHWEGIAEEIRLSRSVGKRGSLLLALVNPGKPWAIGVAHKWDDVVTGWTLHCEEGSAFLRAPSDDDRAWFPEPEFQPEPWREGEGNGPSEARVRAFFSLPAKSVAPVAKPVASKPAVKAPPAVKSEPATAASLDALKAKFGKKR